MVDAAVGTYAHEIACTDLSDGSQTSIQALADGKIAVLDFWTTRCTRCPMAIGKLNEKAAALVYKDKVVFFTVNCDDAVFAKETCEDEEWDNMTNVFISNEVKEQIKSKWGLTTVPHYTMIDADGKIVQNASQDSATKFDFEAVETMAEAFVPGSVTPSKRTVKPLDISPIDDKPDEASAGNAAGAAARPQPAATGDDDADLELVLEQNETMRLRIAEISAELMDDGPTSPGYGSNPLSGTIEVEEEPLLKENPSRFVIFPICEQGIWAMYKNVESHFWNAEEIDCSQEPAEWLKLTTTEQAFIGQLLPSLCAVTNGVLANLLHRFTQEVQATEARFFFGNEISMLGMHGEMYSMLLEAYLPDQPDKIIELQEKSAAVPALMRKVEWCEQWKNSTASFGHRLIGFAAVQSVMNAGSHAAISWLKKRSVLAGLTHANDNISRDLGKYVEFQALLHSMLTKKAPADDITRIVKDAVSTEKAYILEGFDVSAIGMVPSEMAAHIEWAADNLMKTLELPALFGTTNPYESWLEVAASPLASASSASLAQTKSVVMENPGDSVLSFGMDDDDF